MDNKHDILALLRGVAAGETAPEEALLKLKEAPFEDLGYAKVDLHRSVRQHSQMAPSSVGSKRWFAPMTRR